MQDLEGMVQELIRSGKVPPSLLEELTEAQGDSARLEALLKRLIALFGPGASAPMNIADYYEEGDGARFSLRWPLGAGNPLATAGLSFDMLDRKTQFFTLFAEWSRREAEGLMALTSGDLQGAQATFLECVERADQIDVAELRARSYENLARLAEKRWDQAGVRSYLDKAEKARSAG